LLEVNPAGTVPVAKDLGTGKFIVDSGVIAEYLEKHFPEHPLGTTTDMYAVCICDDVHHSDHVYA
jgi:glutathione S-transferase